MFYGVCSLYLHANTLFHRCHGLLPATEDFAEQARSVPFFLEITCRILRVIPFWVYFVVWFRDAMSSDLCGHPTLTIDAFMIPSAYHY